MKPAPVSVQLYSLRAEIDAQGMPAILEQVAGHGYAGVEFAGYKGIAPRELRTMLDALGLKASATHGAVPTQENVADIVETAHTLGFSAHVSGPAFGHDVASREAVLAAAETLQAAAVLLKREGIDYAVHNHAYEFDRTFDGATPHDILRDHAPDLLFEIDTYWVAVAGHDPAGVIRRLGRRAPLLHIKDGPIRPDTAMTAVGQGSMSWAPIFEAAAETSPQWAIVELDRCDTDMTEAVRESCRYLLAQGYASGR